MVQPKNPSPAWIKPADAGKKFFLKRKIPQQTSVISSPPKKRIAKSPQQSSPIKQDRDYDTLFSNCVKNDTSFAGSEYESAPKKTFTDLPVDLRPATRLKVTSTKMFPWITKTRVTAASTVNIPKNDAIDGRRAVRGLDLDKDVMGAVSKLSPLAQLEALAVFYCYPDFSAFQLPIFPRLEATIRHNQSKAPSLQQRGQSDIENVAAHWSRAFEALYDDWRRGDLRTFYIFAFNTTIMFTKCVNLNTSATTDTAGLSDETVWAMAGEPKHRVIITPTTSGIRELIKDEGIEFDFPLTNKPKRDSKFDLDTNSDDVVLHHNEENQAPVYKTPEKAVKVHNEKSPDSGDDHDEWLRDIGISPRSNLGFGRYATISDFSLHNSMSNIAADESTLSAFEENTVSEIAKSTILITDCRSIHSFFNLFNTSKDFRASTGIQAGLPPTLVSTAPFKYCTYSSLNKTSQIVKKPGKSSKLEYVLELSGGPILSHVPTLIMTFLRSQPEIMTKDNKITVSVSGRHPYLGLNETVDPEYYLNYQEFTYTPATGEYEI